MKKNNKKGFTLVELIAVIALIAIVAIVTVPKIVSIFTNSKDQVLDIEANKVLDAAKIWVSDYCDNPINDSYKCDDTYTYGLSIGDSTEKFVCLSTLKENKLIDDISYNGANCEAAVLFDENGTNGKTYMWCENSETGDVLYPPSEDQSGYKFKGYCVTSVASTGTIPVDLYIQGESTKINTINVNYGEKYGTLPTPIKAGFTFKYWQYDNYGTKYQVTENTVVRDSETHKLYAVFDIKKYTLTLNWDNGSTSQTPKKLEVEYNKVNSLAVTGTPTKTGYTYKGFNDSTSTKWIIDENGNFNSNVEGYTGSSGEWIYANSTTLVAKWDPNTYNVTYNLNYDSKTISKSQVYKQTYNVPTSAELTRVGYVFDGWYTAADSTGTLVDTTKTYENAGNSTLYAHWKKAKYYLDLNGNIDGVNQQNLKYFGTADVYVNGAIADKGDNVTDFYQELEYGDTYEIKNVTATAGYTYIGCDTATSGTMGAGRVIVRLKFETSTYRVTLDARGGSASKSYIDVKYGSQYGTLPDASKTGYTFNGWYTATSGGTKVESTTTMGTSDTTIYAQYTANTYTLTYNANGGSVSPTSKSVTYDVQYGTLPTPTYDGKIFAGWYTDASGGTQVAETTKMGAGNVTIYAHWNQSTVTCSAGRYLQSGRSYLCSACPSGYYCPGGTYIQGYSSDQGINKCPGIYSSSSSYSDSVSDCYYRTSSGYYIASAYAGSQTLCPANYYCTSSEVYYGSTGSISACSSGKISNAGSSSSSSCRNLSKNQKLIRYAYRQILHRDGTYDEYNNLASMVGWRLDSAINTNIHTVNSGISVQNDAESAAFAVIISYEFLSNYKKSWELATDHCSTESSQSYTTYTDEIFTSINSNGQYNRYQLVYDLYKFFLYRCPSASEASSWIAAIDDNTVTNFTFNINGTNYTLGLPNGIVTVVHGIAGSSECKSKLCKTFN